MVPCAVTRRLYLPLAAYAPPATLPPQATDCRPAASSPALTVRRTSSPRTSATVTSARRVSLNATATVSRTPSPFGEHVWGLTLGKPSVRSTTTARRIVALLPARSVSYTHLRAH